MKSIYLESLKNQRYANKNCLQVHVNPNKSVVFQRQYHQFSWHGSGRTLENNSRPIFVRTLNRTRVLSSGEVTRKRNTEQSWELPVPSVPKIVSNERLGFPEKQDLYSVTVPSHHIRETPQEKFERLSRVWKTETQHMSLSSDKVMHYAYQQIIAMGTGAVSFLLQDMKANLTHWFWALYIITGVNPVRPEDEGRIRKMAAAWWTWGRDHGYVQ